MLNRSPCTIHSDSGRRGTGGGSIERRGVACRAHVRLIEKMMSFHTSSAVPPPSTTKGHAAGASIEKKK